MIFNDGKYKNLHAAQPNELEVIAKQVEKDQYYRPSYHLAPSTGLLNDPNGLIFDGTKFHLFYQWFPFSAMHGMKHWKHLTTRNFHNYKSAETMIPEYEFESHGCYSGGGLLVNNKIATFYTGNTRRAKDNQRVPYQNFALFHKNGRLIKKQVLLNQAPAGYTEHFRDPKPYWTENHKIRFICGAQRQDLSGTAVIFEMDELNQTPKLIGELNLPAFDNQQVFMWECPDLFRIGDKDIFIWSPQGKIRQQHQYQNNYHATYAIGKLENTDFQAEHIAELDQGFDFYAPQTFANVENRCLMLAWCGLPDLTYPTDQYQWHSMLTMPRELTIKNGKLYQQPIAEIYQKMGSLVRFSLSADEVAYLDDLDQLYLKFDVDNQEFAMDFFSNQQGQQLKLSYQKEKNLLILDRSLTEQTESMRQFGEQRYCEIPNLQQIEIFFDRSIVEIFINQGEKTMTSRFFIPNRSKQINVSREIMFQIGYPMAIKID